MTKDSIYFKKCAWFNHLEESDPFKENINTLSRKLKPNEHYEVRKHHGSKQLIIAKNKSWWNELQYFFQKNKKNKEVKKVISNTLVTLINTFPKEMSEKDIKRTQGFFFKRLAKLSNEVFDRRILGDKDKIDTKFLPEILNPKLAETKKNINLTSELNNLRKLDRRIEKTKLALKLGIPLELISVGVSGSYFAADFKMKKIGVFKPGSEESGINSPKNKNKIDKINKQAAFWPGGEYIAEAMTSQLAEHLNISLVARSKIATLESEQFFSAQNLKTATQETGSYQIFVQKAKTPQDKFHLSKYTPHIKLKVWRYKDKISKKILPEEVELMAIIDGLNGNRDRNFGNWLLDKKYRITLIDHGVSFPKENTTKKDLYGRQNQYKWRLLPQANSHFSSNVKETVPSLLRGEPLKALIAKLQAVGNDVSNPNAKKFTDKDGINSQELAFKQRVVVLLVALENDLTLREFAKIKFIEDMESFY